MNKFFVAVSLLISFSAWSGNTVNNGGDVLPQERVPLELYKKVLEQTRANLFVFLNQFQSDIKIRDVIENTEIDVKYDQPCFDSNGAAADGSSVGSLPNSICISIQRLQPKLSMDNYIRQVWALALHEYSHLIGFNETQATDLQQMMVKNFRDIHDDIFVGNQVEHLKNIAVRDVEVIKEYMLKVDTAPYKELANFRFGLSVDINKTRNGQVFNSLEWGLIRAFSYRARYALPIGICSNLYGFHFFDFGDHFCTSKYSNYTYQNRYREVFGDNTTMDITDFYKAMKTDFYWPNGFAPMQITNIKSREDIKKELQDIYSYILSLKKRYEFLKCLE